MIFRQLPLPKKSFFLFGPRGTGKSTWLRKVLPEAHWYNLLRSKELLRLSSDLDLFRREVEALPKSSWIVLDEIQRLPSLLNEVHDIISSLPENDYKFALTGSSARKLKRAGVNLLAGRAIQRKFFTLTSTEVSFELKLDSILRYGMLPDSYLAENDNDRIDYLESYVDTYLKEEIKEEALIRNLEPFIRFLKVAAILNGDQANLSNVSRDAQVKRSTVEGHYSVLEDTLLGFWLPAWQPKAKVKEAAHPKFYFFDSGVVRALSGKLRQDLSDLERGILFETFLINEIRAWISYNNIGAEIYFWRTPSQTEVDLIYVNGDCCIGIEIKAGTKWKSDFAHGLLELLKEKKIKRGLGVYMGEKSQIYQEIEVLPVHTFLKRLWSNELLSLK